MNLLSKDEVARFQRVFKELSEKVGESVLGKQRAIEVSLFALFSGGHLLLEDLPGTGKTTLAKSISEAITAPYSRIQFTPDLLPSDITGSSIFNQETREFEFVSGPIFAAIVLADEINRAGAKTQAALLEAMEEKQVTVDGKTFQLEDPFFVIATQNPIEQSGTYKLPEAQLDRFILKISLGYPDRLALNKILTEDGAQPKLNTASSRKEITLLRSYVQKVYAAPAVIDYVVRIIEATRAFDGVAVGGSVRAAKGLLRVAKTAALAGGRNYTIPQDIKDTAIETLAHRLVLDRKSEFEGLRPERVINEILLQTEVPGGSEA